MWLTGSSNSPLLAFRNRKRRDAVKATHIQGKYIMVSSGRDGFLTHRATSITFLKEFPATPSLHSLLYYGNIIEIEITTTDLLQYLRSIESLAEGTPEQPLNSQSINDTMVLFVAGLNVI